MTIPDKLQTKYQVLMPQTAQAKYCSLVLFSKNNSGIKFQVKKNATIGEAEAKRDATIAEAKANEQRMQVNISV